MIHDHFTTIPNFSQVKEINLKFIITLPQSLTYSDIGERNKLETQYHVITIT